MDKDNKETIEIFEPKLGKFGVTVVGISSLIMNSLTEEAMPGIKQPGKDNKEKRLRVGGRVLTKEEEWERSRYYTKKGKNGFPLSAFKDAVLEVARGKGWWPGTNMSGKLMGAALQLLETNDDPIVEIRGEINKRADIGRRPPKKGTPAMIYRYEYQTGWECDLTIQFNASLISQETICALLDTAGCGIGVGAWRPQREGSHGMFKLKSLNKA